MLSLKHYDWRPVYESQPGDDASYLVDEFYIPALERCRRYDRIAGYFNSGALAVAANGVETFVDNDGHMRLIVGAELQSHDRPILEALQDDLDDRLAEVDEDTLDKRLQILAWLLNEGRLEIRVAEPKHGNWGVFHPKVGLFYDNSDNILSFEGSINETKSGWTYNYERFKVHRSWRSEESAYVSADQDSFEQLWNDEHDYVDVYELPEAIEEGIIEWKSPDSKDAVEDLAKALRGDGETSEGEGTDDEAGESEPPVAATASILSDGGVMPKGLHVAEEASTIDPWPHQRVVSDTVVNTYPQGFLFCDEVGLGKTIEVGFTLSRLGLTEEIQNSLLLVPAGLTQQWQEELWEKFNLNAYRYDRQNNGDYVFVDPFGEEHAPPAAGEVDVDAAQATEPWMESPIWRFVHQEQKEADTPVVVIMSWHTARLSRYWDEVAPGDDTTGRTRAEVPASCRGRSTDEREGVWDAVVVDEAHNARRTTNLYSLLEELRPHTQCYYLLTATPMQLHHAELYDLLTLLGLPEAWDERDRFSEFFQTRRGLRSILDGWDGSSALAEGASVETQKTLDGEYQAGLNTSLSTSEYVFLKLSEELSLEDEAIARQLVLTACELARAYGAAYDGYLDTVDEAIREADLDEFMGEDRQVKYLLYPDEAVQQEPWIVSPSDRRNAVDELSEDGWAVLGDVFTDATPVNALLHRNTRDTLRKYHQAGLLEETVADRDPERKNIPLSDEASAVYERIDEYTKKFYKKAQESSETETQALGFVMTTYRERLTSSVAAIQKSLSRRLEKLEKQRRVVEQHADVDTTTEQQAAVSLSEFSDEEQLEIAEMEDGGESMLGIDISEVVPGDTEEGLQLLRDEIDELQSFIADVQQIEQDPKIEQLRNDLLELDKKGHDRVLVFTQYTDTLDYVRDHLKRTHGENVATYSGRGGEMYDSETDEWYSVSKEKVKRAFAADNSGVDILVGTEAASEGLNLQECGAVINYDLPWNPMKVEQRIGRVDRIGQQHPEITIYHYVYENTIESDIYDALGERIGMFEDVVGDLQPILAEVSKSIKSATLEGDKDASESLSAEMDEAESGDTVEVEDALTGVDTSETADVLENARLEAWESHRHPDVDAVGNDEHENVPFTAEAVEAAFLDVIADGLPELEIECLADLDDLEVDVESEHRDAIYRLRLPAGVSVQHPSEPGTIAHAITEEEDDAVAVMFDGDCVEEYPSLRFLLPGEPLFAQLVSKAREVSDVDLKWTQYGPVSSSTSDCCEEGGTPKVIASLLDVDDERVVLGENGELTQVEEETDLRAWCETFAENRAK
jgi:hypothetical protein